MNRLFVSPLLGAIVAVLFSVTAQAEVIVQGYYRLGEADTGAANGVTGANPTLDSSVNGNNLPRLGGTEVYSSDVATDAGLATGSTLSMDFGSANTTNYYLRSGTPFTQATNNFGVEGWFKITAASAGNHYLVFNGNAASNGWGLLFDGTGGHVKGLFGATATGTALDTGFTPTLNEWFYVAMVRDNGTTSLYVNDTTPLGGATTAAPKTPTGTFEIGANQVGTAVLQGMADEVRVFTFNSGSFSTSDLLIAQVPEPSTLALLAMGLVGLLAYAWRRRR